MGFFNWFWVCFGGCCYSLFGCCLLRFVLLLIFFYVGFVLFCFFNFFVLFVWSVCVCVGCVYLGGLFVCFSSVLFFKYLPKVWYYISRR